MANPKLGYEPVWIFGGSETGREVRLATNQFVALWVHMQPISCAETKPSAREYANASQHVDWVVFKRVRCTATNVENRLQFSDWLKVLIYREVKADSGDEFVGPIQQAYRAAAEGIRARVAVQDVTEVCREVNRAAETATNYADEAAREGGMAWGRWNQRQHEVRALAAQLINAHPDEIAIVRSTTEGINLVAEGLDWRKGDNIVTLADEFPSNV